VLSLNSMTNNYKIGTYEKRYCAEMVRYNLYIHIYIFYAAFIWLLLIINLLLGTWYAELICIETSCIYYNRMLYLKL